MPLVVNKQEKADAIAQAALHVFLRQGFHQTKMADIAIAAHVGKGTLYEYFRNKHDILKHIYNEHLRMFSSGQLAGMLTKTRPSERLLEMIQFIIDHLAEWEMIGVIFIDYYSVARSDDEFLKLFTEVYESTTDYFAELVRQAQQDGEIRKDVDARSAAKTVMCFFDGLILYGSVTKQKSDTMKHAATFLKLFKDSLGIRL